MELETVNRIYLELSQFVTAKTEKELKLEKEIERLRAALQRLASIEAFYLAGSINKGNPADVELIARIDYAQNALGIKGE